MIGTQHPETPITNKETRVSGLKIFSFGWVEAALGLNEARCLS
jgi:hypothetical protein